MCFGAWPPAACQAHEQPLSETEISEPLSTIQHRASGAWLSPIRVEGASIMIVQLVPYVGGPDRCPSPESEPSEMLVLLLWPLYYHSTICHIS